MNKLEDVDYIELKRGAYVIKVQKASERLADTYYVAARGASCWSVGGRLKMKLGKNHVIVCNLNEVECYIERARLGGKLLTTLSSVYLMLKKKDVGCINTAMQEIEGIFDEIAESQKEEGLRRRPHTRRFS